MKGKLLILFFLIPFNSFSQTDKEFIKNLNFKADSILYKNILKGFYLKNIFLSCHSGYIESFTKDSAMRSCENLKPGIENIIYYAFYIDLIFPDNGTSRLGTLRMNNKFELIEDSDLIKKTKYLFFQNEKIKLKIDSVREICKDDDIEKDVFYVGQIIKILTV